MEKIVFLGVEYPLVTFIIAIFMIVFGFLGLIALIVFLITKRKKIIGDKQPKKKRDGRNKH